MESERVKQKKCFYVYDNSAVYIAILNCHIVMGD